MLFGLLCAAQCSTASEPTGLALGELRGSWAGNKWDGDVNAVLVQRPSIPDTLVVSASRPRGSFAPSEAVVIKIAINGTGTYVLDAGAARLHELVGGDVVVATYASTVGELTITGYSGPGGFVEGTFTFDATSSDAGRSYGESARFENGQFLAQVTTQNPRPIPQ